MPIRTIFLLCMSALATMAGGLGVWLLVHAVEEYRFASRVEQVVRVGSLLFTAADRMSMERPTIAELLTAEAPADAAGLRRATEAQNASDAAAANAERQIGELSYPETTTQVAVIRIVRANRVPWHARVLEMLAKPRSQRDPDFFGQYILAFNPMFDALDRALDQGDMTAEHQDGLTMDLLDLARQSWLIRVLDSQRSGPALAKVNAGAPLDTETLERVAEADGRLMTRWDTIDALARRLPNLPDVASAIATARATRVMFDALHAGVIAAGRRGGVYPVVQNDYGGGTIAAAAKMASVRDAALRVARDRAVSARRAAAFSVTVLAAAMLVIVVGTVVVLVLLTRHIVSPLLAITNVIRHLAQRDYDVAIPAMSRSDEIGGLAAALESLRQSAIAAERAESRIAHMARHDALTGLANRVLLQERMEQAVQMTGRGVDCGVLCLDLDRFKAVNDTFGHPVGDKLLQAVSERLQACVRETDLVSRLGGDEFAVLLGELDDPLGASVLAKRIIHALSEPFDLGGQTVSIGASVGIALAPQDSRSAVGLLKSADTALYRAKLDGRGTFRFFEPDMDARLQARFEMERDLRAAIADGLLDLAYQPLYNVEQSALCGFEALLRWRHPVHGLISPAEFIPLAEETGLIVPIGAWVLHRACAEATHWPDHVRVAVNLSAVQFKGGNLLATVREALAESGLPPTRLELEITESMLLNETSGTLATLHALRDLGASISMDDFGTGYSSLSYLRSFPFDKIKIDQSFVRDLGAGEDTRAVVRAVVGLGRSLGIVTTAEGVETLDQLDQLRREGCTQVQGYLLSRPVSATAARQMVMQTTDVAAVD